MINKYFYGTINLNIFLIFKKYVLKHLNIILNNLKNINAELIKMNLLEVKWKPKKIKI